jgi:3-dehydroquinate dehydratase/shikimate dehydrogenase
MSLIAVSILVDPDDDPNALLAMAHRAVEEGADLVEWRVDLLAGSREGVEFAAALVEGCSVPSIVTARSRGEGGEGEAGLDAVLELYRALAERPRPPRYVDVELSAAGQVGDGALTHLGPGVILSSHAPGGRPPDLLQRVAAMSERSSAAVLKIVWTARSLRDNLEAFDLLRDRGRPTACLCMGRFGLMSRVLAPKFGGFLSFAAATAGDETAPGQLTVRDLAGLYRFDDIGPATRVYGIVGWPVEHSLGPQLHNAGFRATGHDGVYLPLPVPPEWEHFKATVGSFLDHPHLDFAGASVTLPHKVHLVRLVEERGGAVDALARRLGAANTLVVRDGSPGCANTDAAGAARAVAEGMGAADLHGRRVLLLGAGGAARAVAAGLGDLGAEIVVHARRPARARELVDVLRIGEVAESTDALLGARFDLIANCTPAGMEGGPDPDGIPLPEGVELDEHTTVFDTVYRPARTPLLERAEARGAQIIPGLRMFLAQASAQFEMWTGAPLPPALTAEAGTWECS